MSKHRIAIDPIPRSRIDCSSMLESLLTSLILNFDVNILYFSIKKKISKFNNSMQSSRSRRVRVSGKKKKDKISIIIVSAMIYACEC